jgi:hypothetical protein
MEIISDAPGSMPVMLAHPRFRKFRTRSHRRDAAEHGVDLHSRASWDVTRQSRCSSEPYGFSHHQNRSRKLVIGQTCP